MKQNLTVGFRLLLASVILFISPGLSGFAMAGIVMAFPSLKSWKSLKGRLCEGAQTETPELEAIGKVSKQVDDFKATLGNKADKADFKKIEDNLAALKAGVDKWEEKKIDDTIKSINDQIDKFGKQVTEIQEDIQAQKGGGAAGKALPFVTTKDIEDFIASTFKDGRKTGDHAAIKLNAAGHVFKAAETFGYPQFFEGAAGTVTDAFTGRFIDPRLYERRRKRNLILDNFNIETISAPKLIYLLKIEVSGDNASQEDTGGADWIVSGAAKPLRSFRVTTGEVEAKKVAIFGTVEDKLLRDVASLENWIREDFMAEIREEYNDAILNNNPAVDPDAPLGLKQNAIQYAPTAAFTGTITDANEIDAIVAAIAYMASLKEAPDKVFVSDDIYYKILILKGNDGHYQNKGLVYVSTAGQIFIAGIQLIPSDNEDVPSTHLLAVGMDMGFKIKNYGPLVFERGLNGTDFREDKTSFRGYQEALTYIPSHRYNSVLYDTFVNILAAIGVGS